LLFGWTPTDFRSSFGAAELQLSADCSAVDSWLQTRQEQLRKAQISLEFAHSAILRAHENGTVSHTFSPGDQVKVTTEILSVKVAGSQKPKLQPKYVGSFTVLGEVNPDAYRLELPDHYHAVHDVFHVSGLRPWFERDHARTLADDLPQVHAHPALKKVVQVLDRKKVQEGASKCPCFGYPSSVLVCSQGRDDRVGARKLAYRIA
jgi:hypothetical protein